METQNCEIQQFYQKIYEVNAILIKFFIEFEIMHIQGKDLKIMEIFQEKEGK